MGEGGVGVCVWWVWRLCRVVLCVCVEIDGCACVGAVCVVVVVVQTRC